jgi:hypothetical protein
MTTLDPGRALESLAVALGSYELSRLVENCVGGMMGAGTWLSLMDELCARGEVRKVRRPRGPEQPGWFGYEAVL